MVLVCPSPRGADTVLVISGRRHAIEPGMESSASLTRILKNVLSSVNSAMKAPVCQSTTTLDLRSRHIRVGEVRFPFLIDAYCDVLIMEQCAAPNWFADVLRHAYDDALCLKGFGGSDGVFICAGTLRGDSTYGPGRQVSEPDSILLLNLFQA